MSQTDYSNKQEENNYANQSEQEEFVEESKQIEEKNKYNENSILKEKRILIGSDGSEYILQPWLSKEKGLEVEKVSGIILKQREDGTFDSFLGGGAFGKFYVALKKSKNNNNNDQEEEICGIKVIVGKLEDLKENLMEAKIQRDLTNGIPSSQESRLMPILDVIEEKDSSGKLIRLNLVMPIASFGNVNSLREKLKLEKDIQLKRLINISIAQDLLIGIWQMHCQNYYHLDIKLENMVVTSQGKKFKKQT